MDQPDRIILVLEDERPLQAVIKAKLEKQNFSVVIARTVNQALDYLKEGIKVEAVWLDHYLFGKESGLDFVTKLKRHKTWKNLPIFVVSNTVNEDKVRSYLRLGVQKCYTKVDYRLDNIIADIKELLEGGEA